MTGRLKPEEFVPFAPSKIDEQIHKHHCKSGRGNDKLYIKRTRDAILAYCFHCGCRGVERSKPVLSISAPELHEVHAENDGADLNSGSVESLHDNAGGGEAVIAGGSSPQLPFSLPHDCRPFAEHPVSGSEQSAQDWVRSFALDVDECIDHKILWSDMLGAVILPLFSTTEFAGYQYRKFPYNKDYPKYVTVLKPGITRKDLVLDVTYTPAPLYEILFLVEDFMSAVILRTMGYLALPLLGTRLYTAQLEQILTIYDYYCIILDNDNRHVKEHQRIIKQRIEAHGRHALIVKLEGDPKRLPRTELIVAIDGSLKNDPRFAKILY